MHQGRVDSNEGVRSVKMTGDEQFGLSVYLVRSFDYAPACFGCGEVLLLISCRGGSGEMSLTSSPLKKCFVGESEAKFIR